MCNFHQPSDNRVVIAYRKGYRVINGLIYYTKTGRNRKVHYDPSTGYPKFTFYYKGKVYKIKCHKLAAYQKYKGKSLVHGIVVRHKDDDILNYDPSNLVLGTQSQNMKDRFREKRKFYV